MNEVEERLAIIFECIQNEQFHVCSSMQTNTFTAQGDRWSKYIEE